jgi:hypothetical protein
LAWISVDTSGTMWDGEDWAESGRETRSERKRRDRVEVAMDGCNYPSQQEFVACRIDKAPKLVVLVDQH